MKIFYIIFTILAILSIGFSVTKLNVENLFQGDSLVALIMIMAALCALVLLTILMVSKKIQEKVKSKK